MKKLKLIFPALILAVFATSCMVEDETVEYDQSPYVVGFKNAVAAESYFVDEGAVLKNYAVDILGGDDGTPAEEDITVTYVIDPASTATEGQEFNFVDNSGTLTIPAGATFANFPLEINTGNLDPNVPTELILNLTSTSSDNAVISALNDQLSITFVGCQSQVDEFTYDIATTRLSDNGLMAVSTETITMTTVNNFFTMSTGPYGPIAGNYAGGNIAAENGFHFVDICGEITINSQGLANNSYSNQVFGSGSVDPDTGVITLTYTITYGSGNQLFQTVYTPQ
ncbi:MAG TPA: hypothetical protein VFM70_09125 [Salinimicrobium sp.]|nr:hypothetical protein [Salinimicrobium sp.]